jgi:hypothetical protein
VRKEENMENIELSACIDCIAFLANGEIIEDRPNLPQEIAENWPPIEWTLHLKSEENPWFSWSPCECCGSRFGGTRETAIAQKK